MHQFFVADEAMQYAFYKVPKALFIENEYQELSTDAKMLYGLLLDRMHLSAKNNWIDKTGTGIIAFRTRKDMPTFFRA